MTFTQNRLIQPFIELDFGSCEIPEQLCPSYMKIYDDMNFSTNPENHTYIKIIPSSYTVFIILYNKKSLNTIKGRNYHSAVPPFLAQAQLSHIMLKSSLHFNILMILTSHHLSKRIY